MNAENCCDEGVQVARIVGVAEPVANFLDARVAFFNDVIRCVLQLEIRGMSPSALAPVQYHQRNQ